MNKPWFREQNGHWYVKYGGKQHRLSKQPYTYAKKPKHPPPAIEQAWIKLLNGEAPVADMPSLTVRAVFDHYLKLRNGKEQNGTSWCLRQLTDHVGDSFPALALRPFHLTQMFEKNRQWAPASQRTITTRILAALNYAVREGLLERNPISSIAGYKPHGRYLRKDAIIIDPGLRQRLEEAAPPPLRAILVGLRESGCRPSELRRARIERCFLDQGILYVPNKTAHLTGKRERTVYLSEGMKTLLCAQIGNRTEGFIFLTMTGKPWKPNNLENWWEKLTKKVPVPEGITLYSYRRSFISSAINEKGINPAHVAQLAGHDLAVLFKHYLAENPEALRKAIEDATRDGPPPSSSPGPAPGQPGQ